MLIPNFYILCYPSTSYAGGTTVQKFFNRFDSNRDRVVSIPEFRAGLGDMGIKMDGPSACVSTGLVVAVGIIVNFNHTEYEPMIKHGPVHPSACLCVSVRFIYVSISLPWVLGVPCIRAERNSSIPETNCCRHCIHPIYILIYILYFSWHSYLFDHHENEHLRN